MRAVEINNQDFIDKLLEAGADPSIKNVRGRTALDYARNDNTREWIQKTLSKALKAQQNSPVVKEKTIEKKESTCSISSKKKKRRRIQIQTEDVDEIRPIAKRAKKDDAPS